MQLRQNVQVALMLRQARHKGILPLLIMVLRGHPFVLDNAGRIWVYAREIVIGD